MTKEFRPCLLVPVYNHPLGDLPLRLREFGLPIIWVDDGSDDAPTLASLAAQAHDDVLVRLRFNQGKGAAVREGIYQAWRRGYTHAVQVDADSQHDLGALPDLLAESAAHPAALVSGRPQFDVSVPRSRFYGRYATHVWVWLNTLSFAIEDSMCGFRSYPIVPTLKLLRWKLLGRRMEFDIDVLVSLFRAGVELRFVSCLVRYPEGGRSHFNAWRDNARISLMHAKHFFTLPLWLLARGKRARDS